MTFYDVLGVEPNAPDDEIKTAYRNLIKAFHPDYYHGDKAFANKKTNEVVTAYETLRDPQKRMEYDASLGIKNERNQSPPPKEPKVDVVAQVRQEIDQLNSAYTTQELVYQLLVFSDAVKKLNERIHALNLTSEQRNQLHEMLFYMARSKAVALHNEQSATVEARTLTNNLLRIFSAYLSFCAILEKDLRTLDKEIERKTIESALEESILKEITNLDWAYPNDTIGYAVSALIEFTNQVSELNDKIVVQKLRQEKQRNLRETLFRMARKKAIALHENRNYEGAQAVLRVLYRVFSDMPTLCAIINRDIETINEAIEIENSQVAAKEAKRKRGRAVVWAILLVGVFWVGMYCLGAKTVSKSNTIPAVTAAPMATKAPTKTTSTPTSALTPVTVTNGKQFVIPTFERVCPFEVHAGSDGDYYIFLKYKCAPDNSTVARTRDKNKSGNEPDVAFYVKAGTTICIDVPIGVYTLYYATGDTFYGQKNLFGKSTRYYTSDEDLVFYASSQYYEGVTLTLYTVSNGNFDTDAINASEFPR